MHLRWTERPQGARALSGVTACSARLIGIQYSIGETGVNASRSSSDIPPSMCLLDHGPCRDRSNGRVALVLRESFDATRDELGEVRHRDAGDAPIR